MNSARRSVSLVFLLILQSVLLGQQTPRFRASTQVVVVDVRVEDDKGNPVKGLSKEDFLVLEEGVPQAVTYFQEISLPVDIPQEVTALVPTVPQSSKLRDAREQTNLSTALAPEKRIFILFFNLSSVSLQDSTFMREGAQEFLEKQFTPVDAAAILVFNKGLSLVTDLTSDRGELLAGLSKIGAINPEVEASLPEEDAESGGEFIADETEFALFDTNQQLTAIQVAADAFKDIPGRKALVYFSSGLSMRNVEIVDQLRWTTDLANRTNLSLYTVDVRGLVALSTGGGAQRQARRSTSLFDGRAALGQLSGLFQSQEGLITLAEDTGGVALIDDNDLTKIFRIVREELSHYYLLAYQAPVSADDGKFHRIQVKSTRPGLTLSYRKGYWTKKPYTALSAAEREQDLQHAILEERSTQDFPVQVSAEFFPYQDGQYIVPVSLIFDYASLRSLAESAELTLETILLARTTDGRVVNGLRDHVEIKPQKKKTDALFLYQNLLLLPAGEYELSVYLRDNRRGHLSRTSRQVTLPSPDDLAFSSVVLSTRLHDSEGQEAFRIKTGAQSTVLENPLKVGNRLLVPQVDSIFHVGDTVYLQGEVRKTNASAATDTGSVPSYRVLILDVSGRELSATPWKSLQEKDQPALWEYKGKFTLNSISAGAYQLRVEFRFGEQTFQVSRNLQIAP